MGQLQYFDNLNSAMEALPVPLENRQRIIDHLKSINAMPRDDQNIIIVSSGNYITVHNKNGGAKKQTAWITKSRVQAKPDGNPENERGEMIELPNFNPHDASEPHNFLTMSSAFVQSITLLCQRPAFATSAKPLEPITPF